jgi:hypothetical protein
MKEKNIAEKIIHEYMDYLLGRNSLRDIIFTDNFKDTIKKNGWTKEFKKLIKQTNDEKELQKELIILCLKMFSNVREVETMTWNELRLIAAICEEEILQIIVDYNYKEIVS